MRLLTRVFRIEQSVVDLRATHVRCLCRGPMLSALVGLAGLGFSFRRGRKIRPRRIHRRRRHSLTLAYDCFRPVGHRLRIRRYHPVRQVGLGMIVI